MTATTRWTCSAPRSRVTGCHHAGGTPVAPSCMVIASSCKEKMLRRDQPPGPRRSNPKLITFKTWVAGFQSGIADLTLETIETFSNLDGSRVASRFRITGRNNGVLGCQRTAGPWRSPALPYSPSRPWASLPAIGSSAAPGSSATSSKDRVGH